MAGLGAVAALVSLLVARLFRLPEAYWAPITTLVTTQSSLGTALAVWWQRFVETALGEPHALVFACSVLFLGLICGLLRSDQPFYRFGGKTLAIVMLVPRAGPASQIVFHRFAEVSIGIGVALVLTVVCQKESPRCRGKDQFLGNPARPNRFLRFERSEITPMTAETRGSPPPSQPLDLRTVIDALPALVVSALPDGCVEFVNQGWREYAGRSLDELTGSGWQAVIHPADTSKFVKEWNAARAAGKALHNEGGHSQNQRRPPHNPPATDERS